MLPVLALNRLRLTKVTPIFLSTLQCRYKSKHELAQSQEAPLDTNVKPLGKKVKENTKTTLYLAVILVGLGVCGKIFFTTISELFSGSSPNNIYSKAVNKCIEHTMVTDKLGYPISAYGEETRRGRRQHVSHGYYIDIDGRKHMRMKFHLKGTAHSGTGHLDMVETDSGSYEYRFLFVQVDDMFKSVIIVEDNRNSQSPASISDLEMQL